ncbi:MAG: GspE/PulE family protein [Burkholderiales bacterium]|nr:GspE/PulE family protein [Burkholderiales bacterium]
MHVSSSHRPPVAHYQGSAVEQLDDLLQRALDLGASDVHVESEASSFRIRLRVDGRLQTVAKPPMALRDAMVSRIKVLARMDIAEKRLPQDGRMHHPHNGRVIDVRVSSLPTVHGEKMVLRLLNFKQERPSLAELGLEKEDEDLLLQAITRPHGMVLVTGPTGSGKTLSLYSCLEHINRVDVNVASVEDPCEIYLPGTNQVSIHERAGLTFASALRALLRQDPDIIMVGEIRDSETAQIAIQAAHTGHLVLSSLHTNDAPSTLERLRHMGIDAFQIASSIHLIVGQRLVRRLCVHCKKPRPNKPGAYQPQGCSHCDDGYKGRIGIYQVMPISSTLQQLILKGSDAVSLSAQARQEGMLTLRQAGWRKVLQGITSEQEVLSLTPDA